ncbi:DUF300-domain-containing protein [Serendipita vermifera]|nr:DUF300-domain-containing protein [Serendipita vermifera]
MAEASHPSQTSSAASGACPTHPPRPDGPPLFQNGVLTFQAHHVGWIVASFFAIIATAVSIWLILKHLTWYTKPRQQRQIVRLLMMVPIYAIISCLAYFFWNHAIPLSLIRDAYEGIILAAFFYLLLEYLAPSAAEQKEYFRTYKLRKWAWPFGWVKRKPEGLYFLQLSKWAILQYCWVRPLTTFSAVIMNMIGIYCEQSWSPRFGSVWILIIVSISVTVAMYFLIQLYLSISDRIKQHKPILQLFSIKAIIFLMFWQTSFLSVLHSMNVIKDTKYMSAQDINVGFAALLQTFEMVLFSFLHVRCFSYVPYRKSERSEQTPKGASFLHVLDFRDFWRETRDGTVYMWRKARGKEAEFEARRRTHFERAMGKSRTLPDIKKDLPTDPHREEEMNDSDADDSPRTELLLKSEKSRLVTEKSNKPSKKDAPDRGAIPKASKAPALEELDFDGEERRQRSWWSRMYGRLSTGDVDEEAAIPSRNSGDRKPKDPNALILPSSKDNVRAYARKAVDLDEPPPPSLLGHRKRDQSSGEKAEASQKKLPASVWDPSITQPPRLPSDIASPDSSPKEAKASLEPLSNPSDANEVKSEKHTREDSFFARIFNRSPDHSKLDDEHEHHVIQLPSLFQRKHDIMKTVKGWDTANPPDVAVSEKPVVQVASEDLPSIPSMSPSPPQPPKDKAPIRQAVQPIAPAQPTPILHQSLSEARRPSLLIADEAGILIHPEIPRAKPRGRVEEWVQATKVHEGTWNSKTASGSSQSRMKVRNSGTLDASTDLQGQPVTTLPPQKLKESYAARGPRKPKQIIMPTPLSPARYPGGTSNGYHGTDNMGRSVAPQRSPHSGPMNPQHQLPPGAGFGRPNMPGMGNFGWPPQPYNQAPFAPTVPINGQPHWNTSAPPFNPYAPYAPLPPLHASPGEILTRRPQAPMSSPDGSGSDTRQSRRRDRKAPSRKRSQSQSPFGIEAASSDAESLPRHPGLRQHTKRQRRQSQPLPDIPVSERSAKRHSDPSQQPDHANKPTGPSDSVANLLNSSNPNSPSSLNGDSRYPRGTSRSNYFDSYDTVSPYLTNIMNDGLPPQNAPRTLSAPNSDSPPGRTQLRR